MTLDPAAQVVEARSRLRAKGLLEGGAFSVRTPGRAAMAFQGDADAQPRVCGLDEDGDPLQSLHAGVYRLRPDAGAVFTAAPPWGARLEGVALPMPAIFDEQARHLGGPVGPLGPGLGGLATGRTAFVREGGVLVLGTCRERAVFNAELLEKCAKAYILAALTRLPIRTLPWLVRFIAGRRLKRELALAAALHAQGGTPTTEGGY